MKTKRLRVPINYLKDKIGFVHFDNCILVMIPSLGTISKRTAITAYVRLCTYAPIRKRVYGYTYKQALCNLLTLNEIRHLNNLYKNENKSKS